MSSYENLEYGKLYHIYNRGINSCNLFSEHSNYEYFIKLYEKYVDPIADTYSWVLMPNHFHFLVRIKEIDEVKHLTGFENLSGVKQPHQYFSNLFNAYTKAYNKVYNRHGSLFERSFKRKLVSHEKYLRQLVLYIHNNPVHHGYCEHPMEYPWSSYLTCISAKPTKIKRDSVIELFNDLNNFQFVHKKEVDIEKIENWLEI